jgi:N-acetylmuramoyl-L-alanine amidase
MKMIGAHALGSNTDSVGVCLVGNFHKEEPTIEQLASCQRLYHQICRIYSRSLEIQFHRPQGIFNSCPGNMLNRTDFLEIVKRGDPYQGVNNG